jgi:acyl-CoA dehydrogenase
MLARHATTDHIRDYLRDLVSNQYLLASATTEIGTGGDTRSSVCAVETDGESFRVVKKAPVISYGQYADAILATARRSAESPPSDQVVVLCDSKDYTLEQTSGWDTLGLRGTCSSGFVLTASGPLDAVMTVPFGDISAQTMLPVSHILWGHVWLGIAAEAVERARKKVQADARKSPGSSTPATLRLAELAALYDQLAQIVRSAARSFDAISEDREALSSISFTVNMNALKVNSSTLVVDIVNQAMQVCGIDAYRLDSQYTMGRLLRDAHSASLMVNNDRILNNNAQLLLMNRGAL